VTTLSSDVSPNCATAPFPHGHVAIASTTQRQMRHLCPAERLDVVALTGQNPVSKSRLAAARADRGFSSEERQPTAASAKSDVPEAIGRKESLEGWSVIGPRASRLKGGRSLQNAQVVEALAHDL
jgi:hypothetical protein